MNNENIITVRKLIEILQNLPQNAPVLVSGYNSGYDSFYHPMLKKVEHFPENMYFDGEYQFKENEVGTEAVILQRIHRDD